MNTSKELFEKEAMEGANSSPLEQPTDVGSALAPQAGTEPDLRQQTIARRAKVCCRSGGKNTVEKGCYRAATEE